MKIIPKLQTAYMPLIVGQQILPVPRSKYRDDFNILDYINWDDDWYSIDEENGQVKYNPDRTLSRNASYTGGPYGKTNLYGFNRKSKYLNNYDAYRNLVNAYIHLNSGKINVTRNEDESSDEYGKLTDNGRSFDEGLLTDLGKRYIDWYINHSADGDLKQRLLEIQKNNYNFLRDDKGNIKSIPRGGNNITNWHDFIFGTNGSENGVALNGKIAQGYSTPYGKVYYYRTPDGTEKFVKDIQGYKVKEGQDDEYNSYLRQKTPYGDFVDFIELEAPDPEQIKSYNHETPEGAIFKKLGEEIHDKKGQLIGRSDDATFTFSDLIRNPRDPRTWHYPTITDEYSNPIYNKDGSFVGEDVISPDRTNDDGSSIRHLPLWIKNMGKFFGNIGKGIGGLFKGNGEPISPAWAQAIRIGIDNAFNTRNTEKLISDMDVALTNYTPVYRQIHGDYIAQQQAQREASRLRTSQPITANQQIQTATDLEDIQKGNQLIEQGNTKDAQMFWNTSEQAFQQTKENARGQDAVANENRRRLVDYNNEIAKLRFDTRRLNMQNWDDFFTNTVEKRVWDEWDRKKAEKIKIQDQLDELYDSRFGMADLHTKKETLQEQLQAELYKTPQNREELEKIRKKIRDIDKEIVARSAYNKLKRYGLYNKESFEKLFPGYIFEESEDQSSSIYPPGYFKPRMQKGGAIGVVAGNPSSGGNKYLEALYARNEKTKTKDENSIQKKDDDEKNRDRMLNNIAETIKGIDGLNSDVDILYQELIQFFNVQRYSDYLPDDPMQFYTTYIRALNRVNQVKQSAKSFDNAYKALDREKTLSSPAIDANGKIYVGIKGTSQIDKITPKEYFDNIGKYQLLRNNEILELRRTHPEYAFSDRLVDDIAYSSTSIEKVYDFIKDILSKVGSDQQTQDMLIRQYGTSAIEGLKNLQRLTQSGRTDEETAQIIAGLTGQLTELNISTKDQVKQAELALYTIGSMLPPNMKSLLMLHSGSEENMIKLLSSIVFQGVSNTIEFKIGGISELDENGNPIGGTGKGKSSGSGSSSEEAEDRWLLNIVSGMGGSKDRITINPGTKAELSVDVENYNTEGLKAGNLEDALQQSKIITISDNRKIYFGDQHVAPEKLRHIVYKGTGFSRTILPTKEDGSPDFTIFERFDAACQKVRDAGMNPNAATTDTKVGKALAEALKEKKLDNLIVNGMPNLKKVGLFMLADGYGTTKGGIKKTKFVSDASGSVNYADIEELLGGKGPDGKYQDYTLDKKDWYLPLESIFDTNYDRVYEGTIYIPISNNTLQASTGSGNKLKESTAYRREQEFQNWENLRDNIDYSKLLNANDTSADKLNN